MQAVLEHVQAYGVAYGVGLLLALPLVYLTRRYSLPIIFYTLEITAYVIVMHVVMWGLVVATKWFKENSSMRALGDPERAPDWQTPLVEFWQRDQYNPPWVFVLECLLVVAIVLLVWRIRPPKVKRRGKRGAALEREKAARAMNPRYRQQMAESAGKKGMYD